MSLTQREQQYFIDGINSLTRKQSIRDKAYGRVDSS